MTAENSIGKKAVKTGFDANVNPLRATVITIRATVLKERNEPSNDIPREIRRRIKIV